MTQMTSRKRRLTAKERVLRKYPDARCIYDPECSAFRIWHDFSIPQSLGIPIRGSVGDIGEQTEETAWTEAARRLEKRK